MDSFLYFVGYGKADEEQLTMDTTRFLFFSPGGRGILCRSLSILSIGSLSNHFWILKIQVQFVSLFLLFMQHYDISFRSAPHH